MTYAEAIEFLYNLRLFGAKLGLENTFKLAEMRGNPQAKLKFIHVAGTNGKGSTCAILESVYRTAGYKTGFFTSPHLVSFTERIQANRKSISESETAELVGQFKNLLLQANGGETDSEKWSFRPTFFEVVTVMALEWFLRQQCEIIIWETGLGGRLDATNIVTPLASVITNIQYDHEKWLGDRLEMIAFEKAGIIKENIPVVTAVEDGEAWRVIQQTAAEKHSPTHRVSTSDYSAIFETATFPLEGGHQLKNAACALKTVELLQREFPVDPGAIRNGLSSVQWPGRFQTLRQDGKEIILDGAHNPDGVLTLKAAFEAKYPGRKAALVMGVFKDKAWEKMSATLRPIVSKVRLAPLHSERTFEPETGVACWKRLGIDDAKSFPSVAEALASVSSEPLVVVAGSLHLIGEAMEYLKISPSSRSERELNEWNAVNI